MKNEIHIVDKTKSPIETKKKLTKNIIGKKKM